MTHHRKQAVPHQTPGKLQKRVRGALVRKPRQHKKIPNPPTQEKNQRKKLMKEHKRKQWFPCRRKNEKKTSQI